MIQGACEKIVRLNVGFLKAMGVTVASGSQSPELQGPMFHTAAILQRTDVLVCFWEMLGMCTYFARKGDMSNKGEASHDYIETDLEIDDTGIRSDTIKEF